jgi:hypothetical protein
MVLTPDSAVTSESIRGGVLSSFSCNSIVHNVNEEIHPRRIQMQVKHLKRQNSI